MKALHLFIITAAGLAAQTAPSPAPATASTTAPAPAREPGLYATLRTSQGDIVVKFFELEAPITVKNFVDLARGTRSWKDPKTGQMVRRPLYPGTTFHRVIAGFMIQGGDPTATGAGEIGYTIPDEFVPTLNFDVPGRLAMANTGDPHTGSSQFFITEVPTPHLNQRHTILGQVVEGQDVVNKIAHLPTVREKPNPTVVLTAVIFKREGPIPEGGIRFQGIVPARKAPPAKKSPPAAK